MYPHNIIVYKDDCYTVYLYYIIYRQYGSGENHFQKCVIPSYAHQNFQIHIDKIECVVVYVAVQCMYIFNKVKVRAVYNKCYLRKLS